MSPARRSGDRSFPVASGRLSTLALSPRGTRLIASESKNDSRLQGRRAIWELDPAGMVEPQHLTDVPVGFSGLALTPQDELLVASTTPAGQVSLRRFPANDREAPLLHRHGLATLTSVDVARDSGSIVVAGTRGNGTSARTHVSITSANGTSRDFDLEVAICACTISPDGSTVALVATGGGREGLGTQRIELLTVSSGVRTVLADEADVDNMSPVFSRDGKFVFWIRRLQGGGGRKNCTSIREHRLGKPAESISEIAGDRDWDVREITPGAWGELYLVAVEESDAHVYRIDSAGISRITRSGSHRSLVVSADLTRSTYLYVLRTTNEGVEVPVRLTPRTADQLPERTLAPRRATLRR